MHQLVASMEHVLINYSDTNVFANLDGQEICVMLVLMIVKIILVPMVIYLIISLLFIIIIVMIINYNFPRNFFIYSFIFCF